MSDIRDMIKLASLMALADSDDEDEDVFGSNLMTPIHMIAAIDRMHRQRNSTDHRTAARSGRSYNASERCCCNCRHSNAGNSTNGRQMVVYQTADDDTDEPGSSAHRPSNRQPSIQYVLSPNSTDRRIMVPSNNAIQLISSDGRIVNSSPQGIILEEIHERKENIGFGFSYSPFLGFGVNLNSSNEDRKMRRVHYLPLYGFAFGNV
ncbi:uncharacterized protein LOC120898172 [Anopheles arabiensis]|nr:uncharacterized protein LOC120898172 [Anopheles arabiensis]XP_040159709.1 uncharacterized protein LOC120898172 [Anopheles arabiensis]XP_040159799.1 uncharacterized protein LOC120898172 [Anopheles arabiensis]